MLVAALVSAGVAVILSYLIAVFRGGVWVVIAVAVGTIAGWATGVFILGFASPSPLSGQALLLTALGTALWAGPAGALAGAYFGQKWRRGISSAYVPPGTPKDSGDE